MGLFGSGPLLEKHGLHNQGRGKGRILFYFTGDIICYIFLFQFPNIIVSLFLPFSPTECSILGFQSEMEKLALTSSVGVNPTFTGAPILRRRSNCQPFFLPTFQRRLATLRYKRFFVSAVKSNRADIASSRDFSKSGINFASSCFSSLEFAYRDLRVLSVENRG